MNLCCRRQTARENRRARFKSCFLTLLGFSIPMALLALLVLGTVSKELLEMALGRQGTEALSLYLVSIHIKHVIHKESLKWSVLILAALSIHRLPLWEYSTPSLRSSSFTAVVDWSFSPSSCSSSHVSPSGRTITSQHHHCFCSEITHNLSFCSFQWTAQFLYCICIL